MQAASCSVVPTQACWDPFSDSYIAVVLEEVGCIWAFDLERVHCVGYSRNASMDVVDGFLRNSSTELAECVDARAYEAGGVSIARCFCRA